MIQYPITFETKVSAASGTAQPWTSESPSGPLSCAIPTEFEGPGGALSPEDLYAQALTNCFVATFQVMAEKSKLVLERVDVNGSLVVDRNEEKRPMMKSFHFDIRIVGAVQPERVTTLVQKALSSGFILNSVKTTLSHTLEFV